MKGNEATYTIPLRKEVLKVAKYDRLKKAVITVKAFLIKHVKSTNIWLGPELNKKLHEKGRKNIPGKIQIKVLKDQDKFKAELVGFPIPLEKDKEEKDKKKKEPKEEEKKEMSKEAAKVEETKKETTDKEPKKTQKPEVKEKARKEKIVTKKEKPKHVKKK